MRPHRLAFLAALATPLLAAAPGAEEVLGTGTWASGQGVAGTYTEVFVQVELNDGSPFGGVVVVLFLERIDEGSVGRTFRLDSGADFDLAVATLKDGLPNGVGLKDGPTSPPLSGITIPSEEDFFSFVGCVGYEVVDFQGPNTIEAVELTIDAFEFTSEPGAAFTEYTYAYSVDVLGTKPAPTQTVRLGVPENPLALLPDPVGGPTITQAWEPFVDHGSFVPDAVGDFYVLTLTPANVPLAAGTLLCDPTSPLLVVGAAPAPGAPFPLSIPADCRLLGLTLCLQGASFGPDLQPQLTNALDAQVFDL